MVDQFIYIYIVNQWFTTWSIDQWRNKGHPQKNCLIHVLTGGFLAPIHGSSISNPRRQEVKNLDLRVFEFSDLGILQKSAMYFVAWLFWRVTGRWVVPFGEVFFRSFFVVPWLNHHSITGWENICCFGWVFQRWTRRSGGLDGLKREFWKKEESEESGSGSTRQLWFGLVV